ncbi:glycosyltransferase [Paenibacillus humicola]|uniref:glycosyltransferase n=1 Tax=Paenibacillus humicola TaxID=3110540 RepID=UPI003B833A6D
MRGPGGEAPSVRRLASLPFFRYPECRLALPNPPISANALHDFRPTLVHAAARSTSAWPASVTAESTSLPLVVSYHTHFDRYLPFYNVQWMVKMLWRYINWFHRSRSALVDLKDKGWDG